MFVVARPFRRRLLLALLLVAAFAALALPSLASAAVPAGDITGTVTEAGSGVTDLTVAAYSAGVNPLSSDDAAYDEAVAFASTDSNGDYTMTGLPAGTYTVIAFPNAGDGYLPTFSNGATVYAKATTVTVSTTAGAAASVPLAEGGSITGTISAASGPAADIEVSLYNAGGDEVTGLVSEPGEGLSSYNQDQGVVTAADGSYTITGLPTGAYYVDVNGGDNTPDPSYAGVWYANGATEAAATPVSVTAGAASATVDQTLSAAAQISGTVDLAGGAAYTGGGEVYAYTAGEEADGDASGEATLNDDGTYDIDGLLPGTYSLQFEPAEPTGGAATDLAEGWYDGGGGLAESEATGTTITVAAGASATADGVTLVTGGTISGTVEASGNPAAGVEVTLYDSRDQPVDDAVTGEDGTYSFGGPSSTEENTGFTGYYLPGSYFVGFSVGTDSLDGASAPNLAFQYYDDASTLAAATAVTVSGAGANTPNINATLTAGGTITGTVTDASTGAAVPDIVVVLQDAQGNVLENAYTNPDGTYVLSGVPTGSYYVEFLPIFGLLTGDNSSEYQTQYYGGTQVLAGSSPVSVTAGETTAGINAALSAASTPAQTVTSTTPGATTTTPVDVDVAPTLTGTVPTISGTAKVGDTLTAHASGWTAGTAFSYQWFAGGKMIAGATGSTLKLTGGEYRQAITVAVTGKQSGYVWLTETSLPTSAATEGTLKSLVPKITGTAKVGDKLTARPGSWTTGTRFTYQWFANKKRISGATKATLKLTAKERGARVRVKVTGKLTGYRSAVKSSKATKPIAG